MSFPNISDVVNWLFGTYWTLPIPTFGVLVAFSILVSTWVARKEIERRESSGSLPGSTSENVGELALISAVAGIVGARVFSIADYPEQFLASPVSMIFTRSGFSIFGGLFFGIGAGVAYLKRRAIPIAPMLDAVAPALMLGYGLGRLGCQLAGDGDWGVSADMSLKPAWLPDWLWAQTYDGNILGIAIPHPGVYPTPLYEFFAALCLFAMLYLFRSSRHRPGYLFSIYLLFAGFERLLIEKIRVNVRHDLFGYDLSQAEVVSMAVIIAGLAGVMCSLRSETSRKVLFALGVLSALTACAPV